MHSGENLTQMMSNCTLDEEKGDQKMDKAGAESGAAAAAVAPSGEDYDAAQAGPSTSTYAMIPKSNSASPCGEEASLSTSAAAAPPADDKDAAVARVALPRARSVSNACLYDDESEALDEYELLCIDDCSQENDAVQDLPPCPPPRLRRLTHRRSLQPMPPDLGSKIEREERYRTIRNHFAMVLHAYQCRQYDNIFHGGGLWLCSVPNCRDMKLIVNHLVQCRNRIDCGERLCLSTRHIIAHWLSCSHTGCPICLPLPVPGTFRKLERKNGQV